MNHEGCEVVLVEKENSCESADGRMDGWTDGRTDGRTDATKYIISLASQSITSC